TGVRAALAMTMSVIGKSPEKQLTGMWAGSGKCKSADRRLSSRRADPCCRRAADVCAGFEGAHLIVQKKNRLKTGPLPRKPSLLRTARSKKQGIASRAKNASETPTPSYVERNPKHSPYSRVYRRIGRGPPRTPRSAGSNGHDTMLLWRISVSSAA